MKRQKKYIQAVELLRKARDEQYKTPFFYDCDTLLRVPKYLILAGKYNDAINEAQSILKGKWPMARNAEEFSNFNRHDTMNVLAEAYGKSGNARMQSYYVALANQELAKVPDVRIAAIKREFADSFKTIGTDIGRISSDCGCKNAPCAKWHGKIVSVLGRTVGYPTLDEVDKVALFGADTHHRVDFIDPTVDPL